MIQVLRPFLNEGRAAVGNSATPWYVLLYMLAVCLFNWFALTSGNRTYRGIAFFGTTVHLLAALLQGISAGAVRMLSLGGEHWLMSVGVRLPALLNLPMNSTAVIRELNSRLPWGTALFFGLNLLVAAIRMRKREKLA